MSSSQTGSRFLNLPTEVRLVVYEHCFAVPPSIKLVEYQDWIPNISLLLVCRLITREAEDAYRAAVSAFWNMTKFSIGSIADEFELGLFFSVLDFIDLNGRISTA